MKRKTKLRLNADTCIDLSAEAGEARVHNVDAFESEKDLNIAIEETRRSKQWLVLQIRGDSPHVSLVKENAKDAGKVVLFVHVSREAVYNGFFADSRGTGLPGGFNFLAGWRLLLVEDLNRVLVNPDAVAATTTLDSNADGNKQVMPTIVEDAPVPAVSASSSATSIEAVVAGSPPKSKRAKKKAKKLAQE